MNNQNNQNNQDNLNEAHQDCQENQDCQEKQAYQENQLIIIAGCGGGYDLFCGLPLYSREKQNQILVNFSFTEPILFDHFEKISEKCYYVDANTLKLELDEYTYFPEYKLSRILGHPIYCFVDSPTCYQITSGYKKIIQRHYHMKLGNITIYLVDGGSDSILTGNEKELGTPVEDVMHMKALDNLDTDTYIVRYLVLLGANIDVGHGVELKDIETRLDDLEQKYLVSKKILNKEDPEVMFYMNTFNQCNPEYSIVNSLVTAAINGHRGNYLPEALNQRIRESLVCINEMTITQYIFHLKPVLEENIYQKEITEHMTNNQVDNLIGKYNGYVVV